MRSVSPRFLRALELSLYVAVALVAVSGALRAGRVVGDGVDLYGTFWFYWWIADCVHHLRDPSFTTMMFYPLGKDIFAHTGDNFVDALFSTPFQAVFGFPDYEPWFVAFVMVGNALTFRVLARDLFKSRAAVVISTVLWQLCPVLLFELMCGRITQAFVWFLPLAVRSFLHVGGVDAQARLPGARPHGWRWRDPLLAGLFTGLQAWTYWFMGYFMALFFLWLAVVELGRRHHRLRRLGGWVLAGVAALAVVSPAVLLMHQRATSGLVPGLVPAQAGLLDTPAHIANNISQNLHGYSLLETHGQPVFHYWLWGVGLLVAIVVARDRLRWVGGLVLTLAFAVGPVVAWKDGTVLVPWYLVAYHVVPFFDRLWFPSRLTILSMLAATILLGQLVDRFEGLRAAHLYRLPAMALPLFLLGLNMVEQHRVLAFPLLSRDLTPPRVYRVIHDLGGGLIELPIGMSRPSIAWQPVHQQVTFGGMAENAPVFFPAGYKQRLGNSFINFLRTVTRDPSRQRSYSEQSQKALVDEGFRWVVLNRQMVDSDIHTLEFRSQQLAAGHRPGAILGGTEHQLAPGSARHGRGPPAGLGSRRRRRYSTGPGADQGGPDRALLAR